MPALWKKSYDQPRQHIKKQRHHFPDKGLSSQSHGTQWFEGWLVDENPEISLRILFASFQFFPFLVILPEKITLLPHSTCNSVNHILNFLCQRLIYSKAGPQDQQLCAPSGSHIIWSEGVWINCHQRLLEHQLHSCLPSPIPDVKSDFLLHLISASLLLQRLLAMCMRVRSRMQASMEFLFNRT